MIAQASYIQGDTTSGVITGQGNVGAATGNFTGPNTDEQQSAVILLPQTFPLNTSEFRDASDNVHFRESRSQGLSVLAHEWKEEIDKGGTTGFNRITANSVPSVTVAISGNNRILTAPSGASEYRWGSNINTAVSTGTTNTYTFVNPGHQVVRCFRRIGNNWTASARIAIGTNTCTTCREGVDEDFIAFEEEMGIGFKVYPNPVERDLNVDFNVEEGSHVRLDFIDNGGRVIKTVVDAAHAKGVYTYPIHDFKPLGHQVIYCRLKIGQVFHTKKLVLAER